MNKRTPEEQAMLRHNLYRIGKTILEILAIIAVVWVFIYVWTSFGLSSALGDDYQAYIICQKDDYVNARSGPSRSTSPVGRFEAGDDFWTDGKTKNGFLHVTGSTFEVGECWVHAGYVVYDEPVRVSGTATVVSNGQLAARKYVNGKRRTWLKVNEDVDVIWWSDEWVVTNKGFVMTQYLEMNGE